MARTYIDEMNRVNLPTDNKVNRPTQTKTVIPVTDTDAFDYKKFMRIPNESASVRYCAANAQKTIDTKGTMVWAYLQGEESRTQPGYVYKDPFEAVEAAKRFTTLKKTAKNTWSGKTYVYSRDAETQKEFLVATVEITKVVKWIPRKDED